MKTLGNRLLPVLLSVALPAMSWAADTFTSQEETPYNRVSTDGFSVDNSVTAGQFQGAVVFGSITNFSDASGAPSGELGSTAVYMKSAFVGAPYVSQVVSYQFGAIIPRPDKDELGNALVGMDGEDYWKAEPHNVDQGDDSDTSDVVEASSTTRTGFWWSENANAVFAVSPGTVEITWIGATGSNEEPAGYTADSEHYEKIGDIYFPKLTETYVVSGSPVKTAKTVYWTEGNFNGPLVSIPQSRVGSVRVVYTDDFPETVATPYSEDEKTYYDILDTLWFEVAGNQASLHAYNEEGRVFVELLGDPVDGVRQHLGFEIVDVVKQVAPSDVSIDLGDRVTAWEDGRDDSEYTPKQVAPLEADAFVYRHIDTDTDDITLYAAGETENLNDYQVYWMETGEQGIEWPYRYVRYELNWPTDETKYSHYVRPLVSSPAEAAITAVQLPLGNVPVIHYQDVLSDSDAGAFLNSDYEFYTYLTAGNPVHRTLLRYTSDDNVAFERVYSWQESILSQAEIVVPSTDQGYSPSLLSETTHGGSYNLVNAWDVAVNGALASVASVGGDSVSIFDVVDPQNPSLLATLTDGADGIDRLDGPRAIVMSGNLLLVAAGVDDAVVILDISDPTNPVLKSEIHQDASSTSYFEDPRDLFVSDNRLYVASYGSGVNTSGGLTIFDISNPQSPIHLSTIAHDDSDGTNNFVLAGARGVWVEGSTAYVSSYLRHTVQIIDVSDPASPFHLGQAKHNTGDFTALQFPWGLEVHGDVAYVCSAIGDTLNLIDISEPADPKLLSMIQNNQDGVSTLDGPNSVTVSGNLATVASAGSDALTFINVKDPMAPVVIATASDEEGDITKLNGVRSVAVSGTTAFAVASTDRSFVAFDLLPTLSRSATGLAGTLVADLSAYNSEDGTLRTGGAGVNFPRRVDETAVIGERITPPVGEAATDADGYLPGYINTNYGRLYNPNAYIDPFSSGFDSARTGAIIPINTMPDDNQLQVLWFRANDADNTKGFETIYWPEVIGNYTLEWPTVPDEIVLASNDGSGPLVSPAATGNIYYQNDSTAAGYNPNEEHALTVAGQVYALRNDLNLTADDNYSSEPYVLLEYTDADGRISMRTWQVLREDTEQGITFDYSIDAGTIVQGPLPLTLMETPINDLNFSENTEVGTGSVTSSTIGTTGTALISFRPDTGYNAFKPFERYILQDPRYSSQVYLYATNGTYPTDGSSSSLSGYLSDSEPLELRSWTGSALNNPYADQQKVMGFMFDGAAGLTAGSSVVIISDGADEDAAFETTVSSVAANWLTIVVPDAYVTRTYTESITDPVLNNRTVTRYEFDSVLTNANKLLIPKTDAGNNDYDTWAIGITAVPSGSLPAETAAFYRGFTLEDRKGNKWVYRGPIDSDTASVNEGFQMQYYYKTLEGFYFPEKGDSQPAVGTITPFLRFQDGNGDYVGDAAEAEGQAYPITYRPSWPADVPEMHMAETLSSSTRGLPTIRGQSSLEILFQSSLATGGTESVVLHDPTREKEYELGTTVNGYTLSEIPSSVATQTYQGDTYFPQLPPHLSERFFMDPNRGTNGALVLSGQFVEETTGDDYLLLNLLGSKDLATLKALCPDSDSDNKYAWDAAIEALGTTMELYTESTTTPGTYEALSANSYTIGYGQVATVTDEDVAVDSYALTATGPGTGYVSIIAGNGEAFTEETDPISIHILKVDSELHDGELKTIESSNPLAEKLTLQQVVDLAGATEDYLFEWKIAAPVDGSAPAVSENQHDRLLAAGATWTHVPFTALEDSVASIPSESGMRTESVSVGSVIALEDIDVNSSSFNSTDLAFEFVLNGTIAMATGEVTPVTLHFDQGTSSAISVAGLATNTATGLSVAPDSADLVPSSYSTLDLEEGTWTDTPHSRLHTTFTTDSDADYSELWISLDRDNTLGVKVYLNGEQVIAVGFDDDDSVEGSPSGFDVLSAPYSVSTALLDDGANSGGIRTHTLVVELFSSASAGFAHTFDVQVDAMERVDRTSLGGWLALDADKHEDGIRAILGETADVQSLSDNYLIMRYQAAKNTHASWVGDGSVNTAWSDWTDPQLAEGWIKRVLGGINPFNQRVSDLYDNTVDSDADVLTEAGARYEGDIALNSDTINDYGLIEIYETVLNRGRALSIDAGINYGPANDALLLAQGYLNDLYMLVGDEAYVDALNPTIGIGTANKTYGEIATSLFSFDGQLATLLEEELALLRGRNDSASPGVETKPVYNRLFWNYTAGIDSGEVIYALNYNISEDEDGNFDGVVDATDAAAMFPQGHGDAYGHYLTALKGYYSLLTDDDFTWVPQTESVDIAGATVQVDYQDEQKFAAAAAAVATAGKRVFDLTWRQDYDADAEGWQHFEEVQSNTSRSVASTRYWAMDHWAARTGIGAYVHWVAGNSMLQEEDTDPDHEGIQVIDRSTVTELTELPIIYEDLQTSVDNAAAGLTPLGLAEGSLAFDINPGQVVGNDSGEYNTHFDQVFDRAKIALRNAVTAFDEAQTVHRNLRSEEDELSDFQLEISQQELAYTNALIEIYGTPYTDDIGPGGTYSTGYDGPDLVHYMYVDDEQISVPGILELESQTDVLIDIQNYQDSDTTGEYKTSFDFIQKRYQTLSVEYAEYNQNAHYITYTLDSHGFLEKPTSWTGRRESPGEIQRAISAVIIAHNRAHDELIAHEYVKYTLDRQLDLFEAQTTARNSIRGHLESQDEKTTTLEKLQLGAAIAQLTSEYAVESLDLSGQAAEKAIPNSAIFGFASGGDIFSSVKSIRAAAAGVAVAFLRAGNLATQFTSGVREREVMESIRDLDLDIESEEWSQAEREAIFELELTLSDLQGSLYGISRRLQELKNAQNNYRAIVAKGERILAEREIFRQRAAARVQGYRVRDVAFRAFRTEKLERYDSLFDLAARYAFLAAQAFDYETGLLHSDEGQEFIQEIVESRSLGVVRDGEPQFGGSDSGDPGLSSALAKLAAEWQVLKPRLGFNNPDIYGTTTSLRTEAFRVLPNSSGDSEWTDVLQEALVEDIMSDADVARQCLQAERGDDQLTPGLIIEFETSIENGLNLFGNTLAGGDNRFSASTFANKIFSVGVALEGYVGMNDPTANSATTGSSSTTEPSALFLDNTALAATPDIYLIPVGVDIMRSPPLGDQSVLRSWSVNDVTIPLPFNLGDSDYSTKELWQSDDSLTEDLFSIRKHQAFRPVSNADVFVNTTNPQLRPSIYTNNRLIGRSIWNTKWKLVIPGHTLLNDPDEGLQRFIDTVSDIKLHFETYSYAGN